MYITKIVSVNEWREKGQYGTKNKKIAWNRNIRKKKCYPKKTKVGHKCIRMKTWLLYGWNFSSSLQSPSSQSPLCLESYANMTVEKKNADQRKSNQNMCRRFLKDKIKILKSFRSNLIKKRAFC